VYELIPGGEENRARSRRSPWFWGIVTVLALLVVVSGAAVAWGAVAYLNAPARVNVADETSQFMEIAALPSDVETQPIRAISQITLPTATPRAQVIVQPPPEGVDYETAVFMNVYTQVNPSVVHLSIYQLGSSIVGESSVTGIDRDTLYPISTGSGFVWDTEGHLVTNNHVVEGADRILIRFSDGTMSVGEVVGTDVDSDLAVVQMDPEGYTLHPIVLGDLNNVQVGQRVAAIGNPFGLEGTLTTGIVSAIGRTIPARASFSIPASIQTDAPINPGNSGGPLLNEKGELIGVNAQIRSEERANSGVGFAIPVSIVERVVPALIAEGRYAHPYMGVSGLTFSPICAQEQGLPSTVRGAVVSRVLVGTPAQRAGLQAGRTEIDSEYFDVCPDMVGGDLITAVNGEGVISFDDVLSYLQRFTSPGDTITLSILRNGVEIEVSLTLDARPSTVR